MFVERFDDKKIKKITNKRKICISVSGETGSPILISQLSFEIAVNIRITVTEITKKRLYKVIKNAFLNFKLATYCHN